jgi:L-rhamnose mutarotase
MQRFCLLLDLVDNPTLINQYIKHHDQIWPAITQSIQAAGILSMEIYRSANRLTMIMETTDSFSFEAKAAMDAANPTVQQWETLMWQYQKALPWAQPGEKWVKMDRIFKL